MSYKARNTGPIRYKFSDISPTILAITKGANPPSKTVGDKKLLSKSVSSALYDTSELFKSCADGERTKHLTSLTGHFLGKGIDIENVKQIASMWNEKNIEPLPQEKIISTCESMMRTHTRNHDETEYDTEDKVLLPLFDVSTCGVGHFILTPPKPRAWLLAGLLPFGKTGMIVATGGTGKTQLLFQLATCVATGTRFCDLWDVGKIGKVILILAEEDEDEIHRRVSNTATQMLTTQTQRAMLSNNLLVKSMVSENNLMTTTNKKGEVERTDYAERLIKALEDIDDIALIIIDPAARFRGGNENASEDSTRFVEALEYLRKKTGATVLVAHHTNKVSSSSEEPSQNASRGSSALTDGVRWQMNLASLSKAECTSNGIPDSDRLKYLKAAVTKNNYGPPVDPVLLMRGDGGFLIPVPAGGPKRTRDELDKLAILRKIVEIKLKPISSTSFRSSYAGADKTMKISDNRMRDTIKIACNEGLCEIKESKLKITAAGENWLEIRKQIAVNPDKMMHPKAKLSSHESIMESMS